MLFLALVVLLMAMPLPAQALSSHDEVAVSRLNSTNNSEFIEIYNYAAEPLDIMKLDVRVFNSNGTQNLSKNFDKVTWLGGGFVLIAQGGSKENSDENYVANSITPLGGRIEVYFDLELVSEICWGSIVCENHVVIADNAIFMTEDCQADENCAEATVRWGGLVDAEMCQFNSNIFASSENCIEPDDDEDLPKLSSRRLVISEIAARICAIDQPNCTNEQARGGGFIEIYNNSPEDFDLSGWRVQYASATATNSYQPGNFSTLATITEPILGFEWLVLPVAVGSADNGYVRIIDPAGETIDIVGWGRAAAAKGDKPAEKITFNNSIQRCELADGYLVDSGSNEGDFTTYVNPTRGEGVACLPPKPINPCEGLILSEIAANVDNQFIEIANPTNQNINLTDCQLMTNRNQNQYVLDEGILPGGGYLAIYIKDTNLILTKTTTGTVYLLSSDGVRVDSVTYANLSKETAWALVDGVWRQTYELTPGGANIWEAYAACPMGQYRNLDTGRCRNLETTAGLVPCNEGYERNPLTNRCRKIVVEEDALKPCAEGWERNPETNRCRKIVSTDSATFALQPTDPTGGTMGYILASASVLVVTTGIVLFQFRLEVANLARRLLPKRVKMST